VVPGGDVSATSAQPAPKKSWTTLSPDDPNNVGMQQIRKAQADERNRGAMSRAYGGAWDQIKDDISSGNYGSAAGTALWTGMNTVNGMFPMLSAMDNASNWLDNKLGGQNVPTAILDHVMGPAQNMVTPLTKTPPKPEDIANATQQAEQKKDPPPPTLAQRQAEFDQSMRGAGSGSASADAAGVDPTDAAGLQANAGVQYLGQNKDAQQAFNNLQAARKNDITASTDANGHLALTNLGFNPKAGQAATQSGSGNTGPNIDLAGANARTQAALAMLGAQDANPAGPRGGSISNPDASNGLSSMMRPVRLPNGSYAYTSAQTQAAAQQQSQASSNAAQMQAQSMRDAAQAQQTATTEAGADRRYAATNAISQGDLALRQQTQAQQMRASKPLLDAQQRYLDAQTPEEKSLAAQQLRDLQGKTTASTWHPVVVPGGTDAMGNKSDPFVGSVNEQTGEFRRFSVGQQSPYPDEYQLTGKDGKVYVVKNGQPVLAK